MAETKIEWADTVLNPTTGCSRVSPGCANCYMFTLYPRLTAMGVRGYEHAPDVVTLLPDRIEQPYTWRKPRRVFVNSMSDLFEERVPFDFIDRMFYVMEDTPQHRYMVLTKRPERAALYSKRVGDWPDNIWIGTSVESQRYAGRIAELSAIPAKVRFLSAEPLIDRLSIAEHLKQGRLEWVIAGGESGHKARPMDIAWARKLRDECAEYDVPFFLKQLGSRLGKGGGKGGGDDALLDGQLYREEPA